MRIQPVVLAGGSGTRLWPVSRSDFPKQFLTLASDISLLQQTLQRCSDTTIYEPPIVLTNNTFRFHVAAQAEEIGVKLKAIILEPSAQNTAPALAALAAFASHEAEDMLVHVMPSDHDIVTDDAYWKAVRDAASCAADGHLVTFGIQPDEPATGYGYIRKGEALAHDSFMVDAFIEKPPLEKAQAMLDDGQHVWNSGMFVFRADVFLSELTKFVPDLVGHARDAVSKAVVDLDFLRLDAKSFAQCESISIDYALFEKTDHAAFVPMDVTWSDLGAWDSVWENADKDDDGNVAIGSTMALDSSNSLLISEGPHIAAHGLQDMAVIAAHDTVYIGPLADSQKVKDLVAEIKQSETLSHLVEKHQTAFRPWGETTVLISQDNFKVNRVSIKPGCELSKQKHQHRIEQWVVVSGMAHVTIGDSQREYGEGESVYIAKGAIHQIANAGETALDIIEIQMGVTLDDQDVERL